MGFSLENNFKLCFFFNFILWNIKWFGIYILKKESVNKWDQIIDLINLLHFIKIWFILPPWDYFSLW